MSLSNEISAQKYINLETFSKNGEAMRTPVWFVVDGERIYVRTVADSGKVKRIRRNGRINLAPCKMDGTLLGEWKPVLAREVSDGDVAKKVDRLLDQKYGLMKKLFSLGDIFKKPAQTVLEIREE